jgi:mannose-6-phosphate isomerase-like protein (cupin superfamily)
MYDITSPKQIAAALPALWSPQLIAETAEIGVKVARINGTMGWHTHEHEEKIFFILHGALRIETPTQTIALKEGDLLVVPKGVAHRPVAEQECHIMFIEPKLAA